MNVAAAEGAGALPAADSPPAVPAGGDEALPGDELLHVPATPASSRRPDPLSSPRAGRTERLAVFLLLLAHALLGLQGIWVHSVTYDERTHLPSGMAAAATGEIVLNRQHPPLVKLLAGAAANTARPVLPLANAAFRERREWDFGQEVLYGAGNDAQQLLRRGRLATLALSLLGGLFVYLWSRRLFGGAGGLFSVALWTFSPSILGHDGWVTMDAPLAALATGALYFTWRAFAGPPEERRRSRWALGAGLLLGLALASKFSALVFVAATLPLLLWRPGGEGVVVSASYWRGRFRQAREEKLLGRAILPLVLAAAAALWTCYFFPRDPLFYLHDLGLLYRDLKPDYVFYLAGEFSRRFPHYFAATFALKSTPVELLLVPLIGLAVWHERRRPELLAFLVWPALLFFVATSVMATNQGHRYLLPCYPLLFVLAGSVPAFLAPRLRRSGLLLAVLAAAQAYEAWWHHPDHLSYFNIFAGGPRSGPQWLDDSNVDWGQDVGRLPGFLEEHGIRHIRGLFMGPINPGIYGVSWEPVTTGDLRDAPRPGAYVVSAHMLARGLQLAQDKGWNSDWLHRYQPVDVLGGSLFLYVFPEKGETRGTDGGRARDDEGSEDGGPAGAASAGPGPAPPPP